MNNFYLLIFKLIIKLIGTAYLAEKYVKYIYKFQPDIIEGHDIEHVEGEKYRIRNNVLIAGLCHDLGHGINNYFININCFLGPYSHMYI